MRYVQFVLLREGGLDDELVRVLQDLLVREGADEAVGELRPYRGSVEDKLRRFLDEQFPVDVIFIHRDTDNAGFRAREREIFSAAATISNCPAVIPVTPAQETEAWLLVDEYLIRQVAGNPRGSAPLGLPRIANIENRADPKGILKSALAAASRNTSRDEPDFDAQRKSLLERLDIDGPVRRLASWQRLEEDIRDFIAWNPRTSPRP